MVLQAREEVAQHGLVLREGLVEQLLPAGIEGARMMPALPDVQADQDRKISFHDVVLLERITAGRSHDTRCRHPLLR